MCTQRLTGKMKKIIKKIILKEVAFNPHERAFFHRAFIVKKKKKIIFLRQIRFENKNLGNQLYESFLFLYYSLKFFF